MTFLHQNIPVKENRWSLHAVNTLYSFCGVVSLNCCDELHFWKQVFDGTQLVKELYGHPICQQLTRRPDMIGQTRCHRWGHGSPRTQ
jgi:hypothetical protein